ncbi:MAG: Molybdopterin synthase sulfur carrier subunit [uncultured Thiotrichaceae bacterium]|uniref:Molybdopterin synthase sulfur carrier subunit n=1 Tax=uncultured Thiotrichaceae bacterium TaxID=298394 RepID=A0A6S6S3I2_9GAMM|nr:MAG: Molybdopterin synthase sulfur carrier subunit [uncultured Thiotrichaceae bacterium]
MKIECKLFATLMRFLPADADGHVVMMEVDPSTTAYDIIDHYGICHNEAYLVLQNGVYLYDEQKKIPLNDGDTLAIFPPVAGG